MLKRDITYEDFDGETVTESFYFNLTKTELVELEAHYEGGLQAALQKLIKTNDMRAALEEFQRIVLLSYGVKSPDGKRFMKSDALREEFSQTAAYDALFTELAFQPEAGANFITGIMPKDLPQFVEKLQMQTVEIVDVPIKE